MSRPTMRWLTYSLMTAGIAWVVYLLVTTVEQPEALIPDNWTALVLATALLAISFVGHILTFHIFLNMQKPVPFGMSARLQLVGALLRYLPGRIWGVVYQIGVTQDRLSAPVIVRANLDYAGFYLAGNSLIAIILVGYQLVWSWIPLVLFFLLGVSVMGMMFLGGANRLLRALALVLPERGARLLQSLSETRASPAKILAALVVLVVGWSLYLGAWSLIGKAYPIYEDVDFILLCALYTIASIIGIVSAITPAGLGVREAVFVAFAGISTQMDVVAFIALFGRIWFVFVEFVLFLVVFLFYLSLKVFNEKTSQVRR